MKKEEILPFVAAQMNLKAKTNRRTNTIISHFSVESKYSAKSKTVSARG